MFWKSEKGFFEEKGRVVTYWPREDVRHLIGYRLLWGRVTEGARRATGVTRRSNQERSLTNGKSIAIYRRTKGRDHSGDALRQDERLGGLSQMGHWRYIRLQAQGQGPGVAAKQYRQTGRQTVGRIRAAPQARIRLRAIGRGSGPAYPLLQKKRDTKMIVKEAYSCGNLSVRRLSAAAKVAVSTVGGWVGPQRARPGGPRRCPVSGREVLQQKVRELCDKPRHRTYGYRRIWALLRRDGLVINKKTVWRMMHQMGLSRPKVWGKSARPKRVEKMRPAAANRGWQIDMTSFVLSDLSAVYLVMVMDCYSRKIVGWTLDRRCRAGEWVCALRMALETEALTSKDLCKALVVRSDNGAQPCSKRFVEYLGKVGVRGEYTGYNAPDDKDYASSCTSLA